jgi:hypothetical protein
VSNSYQHGDVNLPVDLGQRAVVATPFDRIADLERSSLRRLLVIDEHLKPRRLALDATPRVAKRGDEQGRSAVWSEALIAVAVGRPAGVSGAI